MNISKIFTYSLLVVMLSFTSALALTKVTTVESRVQIIPSTGASGQTIYKVIGPEKVEYRIEAPPTELNRLAAAVRENPEVVVHFDGEVVDEGGARVFRVTRWKKVVTTTKTTDSMGNEKVETETHTERE